MDTYHTDLCRRLDIPAADMDALIRSARTLRKWFELQCGDSNKSASFVLVQDETDGRWYMEHHPYNGAKSWRVRVVDREKGARARVAEICGRLGLHFHVQTDPRGAALRVSREVIRGNSLDGFAVGV